tara:strand:+ start:8597 stop:8899 length:303 start_codon:yes stop_codon:yes gene_type:complete
MKTYLRVTSMLKNPDTLQNLSAVSTGAAVSNGLFAYLTDNAAAISLIIAFISILITIFATYKNISLSKKRNELTERALKLQEAEAQKGNTVIITDTSPNR